jgi:type II/III secretion system protein
VTNQFRRLAVLVIIGLAFGASGQAQEAPRPPAVQLRVQVVLSKYQGDKKISSMPYTLSVNSERGNSRASLRMGAQVPIVIGTTNVPPPADGKAATPLQSIQYKDVGTNIDCQAYPVDSDGRYKLDISFEDSSVYTLEGQNAMRPGDHPSFRSFRSSNTLLLKDGQTVQFTTATDKLNGEVVKADVTLTVVK